MRTTLQIIERPSPNFNERGGSGIIDMIVIHYTGMKSGAESLARLCDPQSEVSAHYFIDEAGEISRLVPEKQRAWHAGRGFWRGVSDINSRSVGIELQNPGHDWGYVDFPEAQIDALIALLQEIIDRNPIDLRGVIAHSDLAPRRKLDPGEKFPWEKLKAAELCVYPKKQKASAKAALPRKIDLALRTEILRNLAEIGYRIDPQRGYWTENNRAALTAFQRRFRPRLVNGVADTETRRMAAKVAFLHSLYSA
jgi:N-acetylmuramoyl-L-alanine amidase